MIDDYDDIARCIYDDAKDHFKKTNDLNYFSEYYPNTSIDLILARMKPIVGEEMECSIDAPMPCLLKWIMCFHPPRHCSRIICQRHEYLLNNTNKRLIQ